MTSATERSMRWRPGVPKWILYSLVVAAGCTKPDVAVNIYAVGVREPNAVSAGDARIPDDSKVIGVSVGSVHRAYLIEAFTMPQEFHVDTATPDEIRTLGRHVVNDLISGVPISVTHCDDTSCSRVFVGDGSESLDVAVVGWRDGEMELQLLREFFLQDDTVTPLQDHPFQITSWGRWKSDHPDTDIYVGRDNEPFLGQQK